MENNYSIFSLIIIFALIILNVFSLYQRKNSADRYYQELKKYEFSLHTLLSTLRNSVNKQGQQIDKHTVVSLQGSDKHKNLEDLINNNLKIIINFSTINCQACLENEIENINKLIKKVGEQNVIILASYNRVDDLYTFKRLNKINMTIYNRGDNSLGLPESNTSIF